MFAVFERKKKKKEKEEKHTILDSYISQAQENYLGPRTSLQVVPL